MRVGRPRGVSQRGSGFSGQTASGNTTIADDVRVRFFRLTPCGRIPVVMIVAADAECAEMFDDRRESLFVFPPSGIRVSSPDETESAQGFRGLICYGREYLCHFFQLAGRCELFLG